MISGRFQVEYRKLVVRALRLLKTNNVWFRRRKPPDESLLAATKRINIPGNDSHQLSVIR
jgi:hypothetical protein